MRLDSCLACGAQDLREVFDLGEHYVSDFTPSPETAEGKWPLRLQRCEGCGMVQLTEAIPRELLYRTYWYRSGVQPAMVQSLQEVVDWALSFTPLHSGDWAIDIGANDGTLLGLLGARVPGVNRVGFEPARNLEEELRKKCEVLVPDFFPSQEYVAPKAKLITSIAMFYDLADPRGFIQEIRSHLHPEGVWVLQLGDLRAVLEGAFDGICHEHLAYYSLPTLRRLIESEGLQVVGVERNEVNGGSLRLAVMQPRERSVGWNWDLKKVPELELADTVLDTPRGWDEFRVRLARVRDEVRNRIAQVWWDGGQVDALGASTKGNTLLQYFGLTGEPRGADMPDPPTILRWAYERSPAKWGRFTAGSWVEIAEEAATLTPPALLLVLPWHFREALVERARLFFPRGTRLLFPLPEVEEVVL